MKLVHILDVYNEEDYVPHTCLRFSGSLKTLNM